MADLRQVHGRSGEGHGYAGDEFQPLGFLRCQQQGEEGVVGGLGSGAALVAQALKPLGFLFDMLDVAHQATIYFEVVH